MDRVPHQRGRKLFWPRPEAIRSARRRLESGLPVKSKVAAFFGLVTHIAPGGRSLASIARAAAWSRQREVHGPKGLSAAALDRLSRRARARVQRTGNQHTFQRKCKYGHSLTDAYRYVRDGRIQRMCRVCVQLRDARRREARLLRSQLEQELAEVRSELFRRSEDHGAAHTLHNTSCVIKLRARFGALKDQLKRVA